MGEGLHKPETVGRGGRRTTRVCKVDFGLFFRGGENALTEDAKALINGSRVKVDDLTDEAMSKFIQNATAPDKVFKDAGIKAEEVEEGGGVVIQTLDIRQDWDYAGIETKEDDDKLRFNGRYYDSFNFSGDSNSKILRYTDDKGFTAFKMPLGEEANGKQFYAIVSHQQETDERRRTVTADTILGNPTKASVSSGLYDEDPVQFKRLDKKYYIHMPNVDFTAKTDLSHLAKELNLRSISNLTRSPKPLKVTKIIQQVKLGINVNGVACQVVTAGKCVPESFCQERSKPVHYYIDSSFMFTLVLEDSQKGINREIIRAWVEDPTGETA